jgi:hypothetical protein
VAAPATQPAADVSDTTWAGTDSDGDYYVFTFKSGGRVAFTSPSGTYDEAGDTWAQAGSQITISLTDGYATYTGTISGDTMSGTAINTKSHTWTWSFRRQ